MYSFSALKGEFTLTLLRGELSITLQAKNKEKNKPILVVSGRYLELQNFLAPQCQSWWHFR